MTFEDTPCLPTFDVIDNDIKIINATFTKEDGDLVEDILDLVEQESFDIPMAELPGLLDRYPFDIDLVNSVPSRTGQRRWSGRSSRVRRPSPSQVFHVSAAGNRHRHRPWPHAGSQHLARTPREPSVPSRPAQSRDLPGGSWQVCRGPSRVPARGRVRSQFC